MNYLWGAVNAISAPYQYYKDINPATLTGAIDVIVVRRLGLDGTAELFCTPFHVRFGKWQVLRPNEKKVDVAVNGKAVPFSMKIGEAGEAFFVFETDGDVPDDLITSPLLEPTQPISLESPPQEDVGGSGAREGDGGLTDVGQEPDFLDLDAPPTSPARTASKSPISSVSSPDISSQLERTSSNLSTCWYLTAFPRTYTLSELARNICSTFRYPKPLSCSTDDYSWEWGRFPQRSPINMQYPVPIPLQTLDGTSTDDLAMANKLDDFHRSKSLPPEFELEFSDELPSTSPPEVEQLRQLEPLLDGETDYGHGPSSPSQDISPSPQGKQDASKVRYAKTLRLTSEQLQALDLRPGANTITFSLASSGAVACAARIFLWEHTDSVVISDIDGTITKSDALGHMFTLIGRDWTHLGVAKLYTDIHKNGYKIMYLTSRAIGQSDSTRYYLQGIKQNDYQLPEGPVIMSPDRVMASLHREVIMRKPEVFKMACLRDIQRLFGPATPHPFYAGFGNRITDALSYRSVNIPSSRIFTIDSLGEVKMELLDLVGHKSDYIHMTDLVDQMFPPITRKWDNEFTDSNFWKAPLADFPLPDLTPPSPALSARSDSSNKSAFARLRNFSLRSKGSSHSRSFAHRPHLRMPDVGVTWTVLAHTATNDNCRVSNASVTRLSVLPVAVLVRHAFKLWI
ncbi:Lipin/Ned1/Smp2-domain-containing protein [Lactarius quietus]|nr:Lipin/Ned1/Smp2-domain-containing protein [Lactarius quietus]